MQAFEDHQKAWVPLYREVFLMGMLLEDFLNGKFFTVVSNIGNEFILNGNKYPALANEAIMKNLMQLTILRLVT